MAEEVSNRGESSNKINIEFPKNKKCVHARCLIKERRIACNKPKPLAPPPEPPKTNAPPPPPQKECNNDAVYRDLGECLHKCMCEAEKKYGNPTL